MSQPSRMPHGSSTQIEADGPIESSMTSKRFECAVPACKKVFRRKEHLTRHLKSHDTQLQYACHICGRRYARSDVLKRHVEFHPQYYKPKRNFVACTRCRESKTKCDEETPCKPCSRRSLQCVRANSENDVNADSTVLEPPRPHSSSPSSSIFTPQESILRQYVLKDPAAAQRRLDVYFSEIHPSWPILQTPLTVTAAGSPDLLLASIMMLASWLEGVSDHLELFPLVFKEVSEIQLDPNMPLPVLQAMVLCLLYTTFCLATEGMALKAMKIHSNLVTACRFGGIIASQKGMWYASSDASTTDEHQEQRHRLAFAALRLDAYLSTLIDFPPLIRYQELSMPLSQSSHWANAANDEERRKVLENEPTMRKKTSFSFRVHDLFGAPRPNALAPPWTKMDYHFILCAIQPGAWEASHQALRTVPDNLHSRTHFQDLRNVWREYLGAWIRGLEEDCQVRPISLRKDYFTASRAEDMAPQTLLLWHITSLKLHAPADLWALQGRYYKFRPVSTPPKQVSQSYLRPWQICKVARLAVWHSAQIVRVVSRELALKNSTTRLRLNPLAIPALLMSAVVMCGYTYYTRVCPLCTGSPPVDLVNVFEAPESCERLTRWLEEGEGLVDWGKNIFSGFPICQCSMILLSDWFREFLARDKQAEDALVLFLDELKADLW
ncbi:hypothetical protein HD806DRAFT_549872 [Xylariaceae sp. AK1471]|nr:hypothetical protein HD806DRAFT_549872 [Xylariaceae sp. AK1471]